MGIKDRRRKPSIFKDGAAEERAAGKRGAETVDGERGQDRQRHDR